VVADAPPGCGRHVRRILRQRSDVVQVKSDSAEDFVIPYE
jgi:hypothetical protein